MNNRPEYLKSFYEYLGSPTIPKLGKIEPLPKIECTIGELVEQVTKGLKELYNDN